MASRATGQHFYDVGKVYKHLGCRLDCNLVFQARSTYVDVDVMLHLLAVGVGILHISQGNTWYVCVYAAEKLY